MRSDFSAVVGGKDLRVVLEKVVRSAYLLYIMRTVVVGWLILSDYNMNTR